jgi:Uma2 family endonuclease
MSTDTTTGLMTAEEFFDFVHRPENKGRHYELERGRVVEMSRPGELHCHICGNVTFLLGAYLRSRKRGYVLPNDPGLVVEREPDTVRGPDVLFFDQNRPTREMNPKWTENVPTLAVEVWSPNDRPGKMRRRVGQLLGAGVKLVWVVDPEGRDVTVYQAGKEDEVLDATQELTGRDVLPDLRILVADLFYSASDEAPATPA